MKKNIDKSMFADIDRGFDLKQLFIDTDEGQLYATLYYPVTASDKPVSTVTICKPYLEGFVYILSHKFLADLSGFLAGNGYYVINFDYRGFGDSSGDYSDNTCEDCLNDVLAANDAIQSLDGIDIKDSTTIGLFYGANISFCSLVQSDRFQSGILINPVLDIDKYISFLYKLYYTRRVFSRSDKCLEKNQYEEHLKNGGFIDICGYPYSWNHDVALRNMKIDPQLVTTGKSVLYLECGRTMPWSGKEYRFGHIIEHKFLRNNENFLGNGLVDIIDTYLLDVFTTIHEWLNKRE